MMTKEQQLKVDKKLKDKITKLNKGKTIKK